VRGLEIVWKDQAGKTRRRAVDGLSIKTARDELAKARARRARHETEPLNPRTTFGEVADTFERAHVANLRPRSQAVYRQALRDLREAFGSRRITSIGKADLREFVAELRTREHRQGKGMKANTIQVRLSALSAVYSFARDDLSMPVLKPRLKWSERPKPADDARGHRVLIAEELEVVLDACPSSSRLYFETLAQTGARRGEGLGLRPQDVGGGEIRFRVQYGGSYGYTPLKTANSARTIEITRSLEAQLELVSGPERVFEHLTYRTVYDHWCVAVKAAGVADPQPVIHDLRHTHVSRLIAAGWEPQEVADRIGDTLVTTLKVYAHEFDKRRRSEFRRGSLEALYDPEMATNTPPQPAKSTSGDTAEIADLQVRRHRR
jgi:integrase